MKVIGENEPQATKTIRGAFPFPFLAYALENYQ